MTAKTTNLPELQLRLSIVSGLFSCLLLIFLAGDIWVWRGALNNELSQSIIEEGGENALWGASILYGLITLFTFFVMLFNQRWFRWLTFTLLLSFCLLGIQKTVGGLDEYAEEGWYFMLIFCLQNLISLILVKLAYQWARLKNETQSDEEN